MKPLLAIAFGLLCLFAVDTPEAIAANTHSASTTATSNNRYLSAVDSGSLAPSTSMSIGFWIQLHGTSTNDRFAVGKDLPTGREYALGIIPSGAGFKTYAQIAGSETTAVSGSTIMSMKTWYHLAYNWNQITDDFKYYINGALELDDSIPSGADVPDTGSALIIGRRLYNGVGNVANNPVNARIDDVRVYYGDHNWSLDYNCALTSYETNLKAYWKLDNTLLPDATGNGNTLTNNNSVASSTNVGFTDDCAGGGATTTPRAQDVIILE
jgi:hypothetical protein